jgi:hypothetical protein
LREKHQQRHRHNPHEVALRRGSHMGIHRVRAREITRLWRRRIEEDAAWHKVSPSFFTTVAAAMLLFQTPCPGSWVTARCRPASAPLPLCVRSRVRVMEVYTRDGAQSRVRWSIVSPQAPAGAVVAAVPTRTPGSGTHGAGPRGVLGRQMRLGLVPRHDALQASCAVATAELRGRCKVAQHHVHVLPCATSLSAR